MQIALAAADSARGFTSPNPPVGAVILAADGTIAGVGMTQPPGGPHAEVVALDEAGDAARGGTAVVTLEPCNHGLRAPEVEAGPLRAWLHKQRTGRPHITWKYAASLDGRSAAEDGTSQWITGPQARARVHAQRAQIDAIVVGTGTVFADDPWLTARQPTGELAAHQPVRVVVGKREIPSTASILDDTAPTLVLNTDNIDEVVEALGEYTDVLLEGGPRLAGAFLAAGYVDVIEAYIAPILLGAGASALVDAGVHTITDAHRFRLESAVTIGPDILLSLVPESSAPGNEE
nr:dihydrofolate reductase family protein [Rhodococcus sp. YH3-3]